MQNFFRTKKIWLGTFLITLGVFFGVYTVVSAAVATRGIGFQGQLFTGTTPVNGSVSATFTFYDASSGGSAQGSPITKTVSVTNGYFSVAFSEADMAGVDSSQSLWVEVVINGDTLSPRSTVSSVPLANNAFGVLAYNSAPTAGPAGSLYYNASSSELFVSNGSVWSTLQSSTTPSLWDSITGGIAYTGGNVGIGTNSPTQALEVQGRAIIGEAITSANYSTSSLSLVNSGASESKTQLNIINTGGGAGAATAIDFFTYDYANTTPAARLSTLDDGNYSNSFVFSTKNGGDPENGLIERLRIASDGNVGIGTTTPFAKLAITGSGTGTGRAFTVSNSSNVDRFTVLDNGTINLGTTGIINPSAGAGFQIGNPNDSQIFLAYGGIFNPYADLNLGLSFNGNNRISNLYLKGTNSYGINIGPQATPARIYTMSDAANANLIISPDGTGNVGIGTTTPGSLLSIGNTNGINFGTATSTFNSTGGINLASGCFAINGTCIGGGSSSQWTTSSSNIYYNTGNISVGTTTPIGTTNPFPPLAKISAYADSNAQVNLFVGRNANAGSSAQSRVQLFNNSGDVYDQDGAALFLLSSAAGTGYNNALGFWNYENGPILFATNNAERLRISEAGNVGIGTTTPSAKFALTAGGTGTGRTFTIADSSNLDRLTVLDNGTVTVGVPSAPSSLFAVNGVASVITNSGSVNSSTFYVANSGSNNGFYVLRAASGAGDVFNVTNAGNVGIGTTSPVYRLDLRGGSTRLVQSGTPLTTSYALSVQRPDNSAAWVEILNSGGAGKGAFLGLNTNDFELYNYQAGNIIFYTNTSASAGTERMRITNDGNVGIGNASPGSTVRLAINGTGTGTNTILRLADSSNSAKFSFLDNGRFGIGSSTPMASFSILGTGGTSPIIVASSTGTRLFTVTQTGRITTNDSGSDGYIELPTGGILGGVRFGRADSSIIGAFSWYSEPSMTVHPQGYIGFNASTAFEGGNLNGDIRWYRDAAAIVAQRNSTNAQTYRIYNTYTSSTNYERAALAWSGNTFTIGTENMTGSARNLGFMTGSTTRMTIDTSGNVGIGTTTPAFPLDVYASVTSTQSYGYLDASGVTGVSSGSNSYSIRAQGRVLAPEFNAVSDTRLKNVQFAIDQSIALESITKLQPVSFTWKNDPDGQPILGFLAQDVEVVIPNAVSKISTENFADQRSLDYNQIVTMLVGAVKEIKTKIDAVTTQVTAMATWFRADGKLNIENDICIDDVCVTKEQFKQLLLNNGAGAHFDSNPTPSPTPTPTPDPTPVPNDENTNPSEEPTPEPEVVTDTPVDQGTGDTTPVVETAGSPVSTEI